jgi:hypothetical protein
LNCPAFDLVAGSPEYRAMILRPEILPNEQPTRSPQFDVAREAARTLRIPFDGIKCPKLFCDYEEALARVDSKHGDALLQMPSQVHGNPDHRKLRSPPSVPEFARLFAGGDG